MSDENAGTEIEPNAGNEALDALAIETGIVNDAPDPVEKEAPAEEQKPEDKPEDKPVEKPQTALEAVRKVMAETLAKDERKAAEAAEAVKAAKAEPDPAKTEPSEPDGKKDLLTRAEWAALSDKAKARIGWLGNEVKAERKLREDLEPRAKMFDEMANFVNSTGMSQDQFVEGLNIMGWLVTDPARAYTALKPIFQDLQGHMGELLPPDIQSQVDDGRITPEFAQQLVFERSQRTLLETKQAKQVQYQQDLDSQREATEADARRDAEVQRVITDWQNRQMSADPDFRLKAPQISDRAFVILKSEGTKTDQELLQVLDRAKGEIDKRVTGQQPRKSKTPVTVAGVGRTINREPTTALEAARIALASMSS
jgi:hypothetical protein